jgi:hypothetical protein
VEVISLPPKDAEMFYNLAYETTWEEVLKGAPEYGARLRKMLTKEALFKK